MTESLARMIRFVPFALISASPACLRKQRRPEQARRAMRNPSEGPLSSWMQRVVARDRVQALLPRPFRRLKRVWWPWREGLRQRRINEAQRARNLQARDGEGRRSLLGCYKAIGGNPVAHV